MDKLTDKGEPRLAFDLWLIDRQFEMFNQPVSRILKFMAFYNFTNVYRRLLTLVLVPTMKLWQYVLLHLFVCSISDFVLV